RWACVRFCGSSALRYASKYARLDDIAGTGMPFDCANDTARRHDASDCLTRELNSFASSRFGRSRFSSYARMIESRNFARMMQPAFQMRAISRMSMFHFHSAEPAWISAMPCAYEQIFDAY